MPPVGLRGALELAAKAAANAARRLSAWGRGRLGGGGGGAGGSDGPGGRGNTGNDGGSKGGSKGGPGTGTSGGSGHAQGNRSESTGRYGDGEANTGAGNDRTHVLGINVYQSGKDIASSSNSLKILEEYAQEMRSGIRKLHEHLDKYEHSPEAARALAKLATNMSYQFERAGLKTPVRSRLETLLGITDDVEKASKLPRRWFDIAYALGVPAGVRFIYERAFRNMDYSPEPIDCPYTGLLGIVPAREQTLVSIENGFSKMLEILPPRGRHAVEGLLSVLPTDQALEEHGVYVVHPILRRFPKKTNTPVTHDELHYWFLRELDKMKIETPEQAEFIDDQKAILKMFLGGENSAQAGENKRA